MNRATWAILISLTLISLTTSLVVAQEADPAKASDPAAEQAGAAQEELEPSAGASTPPAPEGTNWIFIISVSIGSIGLVLFIVVEVLRAKWKREEGEEDEEDAEGGIDAEEEMPSEEKMPLEEEMLEEEMPLEEEVPFDQEMPMDDETPLDDKMLFEEEME